MLGIIESFSIDIDIISMVLVKGTKALFSTQPRAVLGDNQERLY